MLHDAHFHYTSSLKDIYKNNMQGIASCSNVKEYLQLKELQKECKNLQISLGIHPWYADVSSYDTLVPYLNKVHFIGEIGLDEPWCNVDKNIQKEVFIKQIQFAYKNHKPVILHTKGMEKEIYDIIKEYPNTYLVHWYSCDAYLNDFIHLDCYFTVGPSVGIDPNVNAVALNVPLNRILIESDGLDALEWAFNKKINSEDYLKYLHRSIIEISNLRNMSEEEVEKCIHENYLRFIHN